MRGSAVQIEVVLLHVFTVVALAVRQSEQAFLDDWVLAIPERECETEPLAVVGNAGQSVFAPVVGARPRLVMAEVVPSIAIFAVILTHGPPLAFAQVWSPFFPWSVGVGRVVETLLFAVHDVLWLVLMGWLKVALEATRGARPRRRTPLNQGRARPA